MDKKTTIVLGAAALAIVALFLWQGFGQTSQGSIIITVYDQYGVPVGEPIESGFGIIPGALINGHIPFEQGYSLYVEALVNFNYNLSGISSGSVDGNWTANGTFINAALTEGLATTAKSLKGAYNSPYAINEAGSGTGQLQASLGSFAYSILDEDIPATSTKTLTMAFYTDVRLNAGGAVLKSASGTQTMTITLSSGVSGELSIVSITFSPWVETSATVFF